MAKYEGSKRDVAEDRRGAKKLGVSLKAYEKTARDKREDRAGEKRSAAPKGARSGAANPR